MFDQVEEERTAGNSKRTLPENDDGQKFFPQLFP